MSEIVIASISLSSSKLWSNGGGDIQDARKRRVTFWLSMILSRDKIRAASDAGTLHPQV